MVFRDRYETDKRHVLLRAFLQVLFGTKHNVWAWSRTKYLVGTIARVGYFLLG